MEYSIALFSRAKLYMEGLLDILLLDELNLMNLEDWNKNGRYDILDFIFAPDEKLIEECSMGKNKFSVTIMNPPFDGTTHLEFLSKVNDVSDKVVSVLPATIFIKQKEGGKKIYSQMKKKLEGHINSLEYENMNNVFNIAIHTPCMIISVDNTKNINSFQFTLFGKSEIVNSINDCNLVGNYNLISSIVNKVKKYGNFMKDHIYDPSKITITDDMYFCSFKSIIARNGCGDPRFTDGAYTNGYYKSFYHVGYNDSEGIQKNPIKIMKSGYTHAHPVYTDRLANNLYGTKKELENWEHFILNNKLPLFINIVFSIDQNNNSTDILPWLVDKKYTDEEIYSKLGINKVEKEFIDKVLIKYNRHSKWWKRYLTGDTTIGV